MFGAAVQLGEETSDFFKHGSLIQSAWDLRLAVCLPATLWPPRPLWQAAWKDLLTLGVLGGFVGAAARN